MICKHCSREVDEDSVFCKYCGYGLKGVKFNDVFTNTPEQNLFAQIFGIDMPLDKNLSQEYRRPVPDIKEFEWWFHQKWGEDCPYRNQTPNLKNQVAMMYGDEVAQWLDDLLPGYVTYTRTLSHEDIRKHCLEQSEALHNLL